MAMPRLLQQYLLLMWKNLVLLSRSPFRIVVEIVWPIALFLILYGVRQRDTLVTRVPECHMHNKPMPSAGLLPFFQGIMCTSDNKCYEGPVLDELSGKLTSFQTTTLEELVDDVAIVLANDTQREKLVEAIRLGSKIASILRTQPREHFSNLIGISEGKLYATLQNRSVPLSNASLDVLFYNVTIEPAKILDELQRIQSKDPDFIPLLETFLTDFVDLQSLLVGDSQLWGRAFAEDFVASLQDIPNITLANEIQNRANGLDLSGLGSPTEILQALGSAPTMAARQQIIGDVISGANLPEQIASLANLTDLQNNVLTQYCNDPTNHNTSACLLYELTRNSSDDRVTLLNELCNQDRYSELVTCMMWGFTTVRSLDHADLIAKKLCADNIIKNSTLCSMYEVQQRLIVILNSTSAHEVLCNNDTEIFTYDSEEARAQLQPELCGLDENHLRIVMMTLFEHINITAAKELYFPEGLDPQTLLRTVELFEQLYATPSVRKVITDAQKMQQEGLAAAICGDAQSVAAGFENILAGNTTQPNATTGSDDSNTNPEYKNRNSSEWQHIHKCRHLFAPLRDSTYGKLIFQQLEPILFGKIPYSPNSTLAHNVIQTANLTFKALADVKQASLDVHSQYQVYEQNALAIGKELSLIQELINLASQGDASLDPDISLVSPQEFLQTVFGLSAPAALSAGLPLPMNLTNGSLSYSNILQQLASLTTALQENGTIYQAIDQLGKMADIIYKYLDCVELNKFESYDTEFDVENRSLGLIKNNKYWAAIILQLDSEAEELPSHVSYKIRMNTDKVDSTDKFEDKYWTPGARREPPYDTKYITYGFAYLQDMIEHSLIEWQTNNSAKVGIYLQQFPFPCYTRDNFTNVISRSIPLFLVLSWIFSVALLVKSIVYEKQERLKEQMKIMGLSDGIHWLAWYTVSLMLIMPSIIILVIIFRAGGVLGAANPTIMFFFLFAFSFATTMQAFLFSVFFTRANLAACCGAILYFTMYLPYAVVYNYEEEMTTWQKGFAALLSPVALGMGTTYIARYEQQGVGINFENMHESPLPDDGFNLAKCIAFMFLDGIIYFLLAWWKEHVFPGKYGVPKPVYFMFTPSFWCGNRVKTAPTARDRDANIDMQQAGMCEEEPKDLRLGVKIENLTKIYKSAGKVAVDNLSLNLYEDQITSFLGHNGAGKTTTMSVLCGLFPPTEGNAFIYDSSIVSDMDTVRSSLGFCPQFNVLYDQLTVAEHLMFYGQLKGLTRSEARDEMEKLTKSVGLHHKLGELTKNLSGGMKRKVSVMCAFVGNSRCVILDEPTAGVDPYSRRQIWELLLKFKPGRTILLSTHHMDEADFLGDRIAIISHGKLCCAGSSLFLKSLHGSGYYLTLVRDLSADKGGAVSRNDQAIEDFVCCRVSGAQLVDSQPTEITFQLPASETGTFSKLFEFLDHSLHSLGLSSYGISDTTLEEIFIKVAEETGVDAEKSLTDAGKLPLPLSRRQLSIAAQKFREKFRRRKTPKNKKYQIQADDEQEIIDSETGNGLPPPITDTEDEPDVTPTGVIRLDHAAEEQLDQARRPEQFNVSFNHRSENGVNLPVNQHRQTDKPSFARHIGQQMLAILIKRFTRIRRDKWAFICELVLPAAFILMAMAFALAVPPIQPMPPLVLQPWIYQPERGDPHLNTFFSNDYEGSEFTRYYESLIAEGSYGTRCMDPDVYQIPDRPCGALQSLPWSRYIDDIYPQCECESTGYQQCKELDKKPSNRIVPNTDILHNMTGQDISRWITTTMAENIKRRYGGFSVDIGGHPASINASSLRVVVDAALDPLEPDGSIEETDAHQRSQEIALALEEILDTVNVQENMKVWYNNKGWASSVSYMNAANNVVLRAKLLESHRHRYLQYGITSINHPMNRTDYQLLTKIKERGYVTLLISLCVIFAMSLIPATFTLYLIMDRVSTSKDLQMVSGMNRTVYWITNFIWDMFNYIICCSLCFLIFLAFNEKAYVSVINGPNLFLLMLLYGWSMTPLMYLFHYAFKDTSMAYVVLGCVNIFIGIVSTVSTYILELFPDEPELNQIGDFLKQVFLVFPHFCLGRGLIDISVEHLKAEIFELLGNPVKYDPFAWELTGRNMFSMAIEGVIFLALVIIIENFVMTAQCGSKTPTETENCEELEDDVQAERDAVLNGERPDDVLKVTHLDKVYQTFQCTCMVPGCRSRCFTNHAVRSLTFGVPRGQCFGLLGVNGAGKTTTFRMLTGIDKSTGGDASVAGFKVSSSPRDVQQLLGYCPQFDAIDPLLTGREHLEFFARFRGISSSRVKAEASKLLKKMGLVNYQDKLAGTYSGGNKRKLQAAIALIGNPPVIYLDEPTTGMDPKARRFLWDMIKKITREGHTVVLTTHSMEECEVLCDRLGIMVNGMFQCMGSTQHLKNKYGEGYHVTIRVNKSQPDIGAVLHAMDSQFHTTCQLLENSVTMAQYHVQHTVKVCEIFSRMEAIKAMGCVEEYSVTQTSLDHVFIRFAKVQSDDYVEESQQLVRAASFSTLTPSIADSTVNLVV